MSRRGSTDEDNSFGKSKTLLSGADDSDPPPGRDAAHATVRSSERVAPHVAPPAAAPPKDFPALLTIDSDYYAVTGELAHGGMGRILAARDRRLGRPVAIKELLAGTNNANVRARFERETRITARLQHPGIINLLEAGVWPNGEPFFAMKLVDGESLDKAVDRCATVVDRMGLITHVLAAVDAMAYAHDRGIIHRDLKPQNVLVGKYGETVVIDWGLAKDLNDGEPKTAAGPQNRRGIGAADETLDGEVMGTPAFMPREQALGEVVDARADVYALGAILYYVLSGKPPFVANNSAALLHAVVMDTPAPLDQQVSGLPQDLITIVAKAMAIDPRDRYPSAAELATDLKHFQTGQLVVSHRYSRWQRVSRFVRRHRGAVSVATLALVVFVTTGTIAIRRIMHEQERAESEREIAVDNRSEAEGLMNFMLFDLRDKLKPMGKIGLLEVVARRANDYYMRHPERGSDADQRMRAHAMGNLADVLVALGDLPSAMTQMRTAIAIMEKIVANGHGTILDRQQLAALQCALATAHSAQGDAKSAVAGYRRALVLNEGVAADDPKSPDAQLQIAVTQTAFANELMREGDAESALAHFRLALLAAERGFLLDPMMHDWGEQLVSIHQAIGAPLMALGDAKGALAEQRAALALAVQVAAAAPLDVNAQRRAGICHQKVGTVLFAMGDSQGALIEARADTQIATALGAHDPTNEIWQSDLASSRNFVANILLARGDTAGALVELRAALAISERRAAQDPTDARQQRALLVSYNNLGDVLDALKDVAGALASHQSALALAQKLVDADPTSKPRQDDLVLCHNGVGTALLALGRTEEAEAQYRAALVAAEKRAAQDPTDTSGQRGVLISHGNLAELLQSRGDSTGALVEFAMTLKIAEKLAADAPSDADVQGDLIECHGAMAGTLLALGRRDEALAEYRAALAVARKAVSLDPANADRQHAVTELTERVATCCTEAPRPGPRPKQRR